MMHRYVGRKVAVLFIGLPLSAAATTITIDTRRREKV